MIIGVGTAARGSSAPAPDLVLSDFPQLLSSFSSASSGFSKLLYSASNLFAPLRFGPFADERADAIEQAEVTFGEAPVETSGSLR